MKTFWNCFSVEVFANKQVRKLTLFPILPTGHFRTCSELSSVSCQSENGDSGEGTDRLSKKISELSEILEAR